MTYNVLGGTLNLAPSLSIYPPSALCDTEYIRAVAKSLSFQTVMNGIRRRCGVAAFLLFWRRLEMQLLTYLLSGQLAVSGRTALISTSVSSVSVYTPCNQTRTQNGA